MRFMASFENLMAISMENMMKKNENSSFADCFAKIEQDVWGKSMQNISSNWGTKHFSHAYVAWLEQFWDLRAGQEVIISYGQSWKITTFKG